MTEAGSGSVQKKQKALLSEIIEQLNDAFGTDMTDGDQLSYVTTVLEKTLESETLQPQAASNSKQQFASSPDLNTEIVDAIIESMDAQGELSKRAVESAKIRAGIRRLLLVRLDLYEKLRARAGEG